MKGLERSAKAWMDAVQAECPILPPISVATVALQRALLEIEVNEQELADVKQELADFRQEVSDVVWDYYGGKHIPRTSMFAKFAIPKPDPLVAALEGVTFDHYPLNDAKTIRAALEARGLKIVEVKNDDA